MTTGASEACRHCGDSPIEHPDEHPNLCCDCFDLSHGMPVAAVNAGRAAKGKPPVPPWPRSRGA
jgi:hypothetical protein